MSQAHHDVQEKSRLDIFVDYSLSVELYLDDIVDASARRTSTSAKYLAFVRAQYPPDRVHTAVAVESWFGVSPNDKAIVQYDTMEAVLFPGKIILVLSFGTEQDCGQLLQRSKLPIDSKVSNVQIKRGYSKTGREKKHPQLW